MSQRQSNDRSDDARMTDDSRLLEDDDMVASEEDAPLDPDEVSDLDEQFDVEASARLPEELTGRASGTDEDLVALFDNPTDKHMADGFRGGSEDEPPVDDDEFENDPAQSSV